MIIGCINLDPTTPTMPTEAVTDARGMFIVLKLSNKKCNMCA